MTYRCSTRTLPKRMENWFDGSYTRMLPAILSWRQQPTKQQLYGHLPPITITIKIRQTRHAGHCWRSRDKVVNDILLWTTSHGRAKTGRPVRIYIQQLCADTGCSREDLQKVMDDWEVWRETVRNIRADSVTWWYIYIYIYIYIQKDILNALCYFLKYIITFD